jgi:predicted phage terminase large subunit-like protein
LRRRAIERARGSLTSYKLLIWRRYQHAPHLDALDRLLAQCSQHAATGGAEGIGHLIVEMPPRHGKCVVAGTPVTLATGERKPIEQVCHSDMVISLTIGHNSSRARVIANHENGARPVLKITLLSGRYIVCTENHPLLTVAGWRPADALKVGDAIAAHRRITAEGEPLEPDLAALLGYIVGDGTNTPSAKQIHFTSATPEIVTHLSEILRRRGWELRKVPSQSYDYRLMNPVIVGRKRGDSPTGYVRRYMAPALAGDKRVPPVIFTASDADVTTFLGAYFNCDGSVTGFREGIAEFYSVSEGLLRDTQYLLVRLGIYSSLRPKKGRYNGQEHLSWRLIISGADLVRFAELVPVIGEKGAKLQRIAERSRSKAHYPEYDAIPNGWQEHLNIGKGTLRLRHGIRVDKHYKRGTARQVVLKIAEIDDNDALRRLCSPDVIWERITKIEPLGDMPTYDIEVEGTHNYSVDGIVSHNTTTISRLFPTWHLGNNPEHRVILASYGASLAEKNSRYARNVLMLPRYQAVFPGVALDMASRAADAWDLAAPHEGGLDAIGVGGGVTGKGGHIIIVDDPVKSRAEAESETYREKVWDWFTDDLYTRREPGAAVIVVMTRWHQDDLAGRLLNRQPGVWTRLRMPALAEPDDDLERIEGAALWPDRYPLRELTNIRATLGEYSWSALYQQRPVPAEGGLFKRAAFHLIPRAPEVARAVRYWDLAMSDRTSADYTVGVLLGQTEAGRLVVLDVARAQLDWSSVPSFMAETALRDGPDVALGFEEKGYMSRAGQELAQDSRLHNFSIWGFPKDKDKLTNALPFAARVGQGLVDIVEGHWAWEFIDELCSFPAGEHDDQVDAASGAYGMLGTIAGSASLTYADEYTIGAGDF